MYIKELEIDKFKSFANKTNIPFLKGFTTIAGPNGSGKSNIIDAILFSLGLATTSEMRGEKLSEFISKHTRQNEASVAVTFDTENKDEPYLKIQRKIKKTNQGYNSIYSLNDKVTTLSEIHSVLDKYNVSPNSYNVIMQNDVYNVTNCTTGQRRKILEEIAGTADFDRRINQATQELDIVEKRVEKSILILDEVSKNLEALEQEREQALKYQKLRDEKTSYESQITVVKYFDTQKSIELVHQNILDFNKKKKEKEIKLKDTEKDINETKAQFDKIEELVKSKGEAKQLEVKKQVEEKLGEISRKKNSANFAQKTITQNLQNIENTKNGIENAEKKIEENKKNIEAKKVEITSIDEEIATQKAELEKISLEVAGLSQTANEYIVKRNELKTQLDNAKNEDLNIEKQKAPMEAKYSNLKRELSQIEETLQNLEQFKINFESKKESLTSQINELSTEMNDFRSIQERVMNDLDKTKNQLSSLDFDIRTAQQTIARLEGQKLAYEEANLGREIDTIMRAKLKGVHAPLVQLGVVDKEYSDALEIAMGARMRNVVVDDDYVARQAIEILKSNNAGRLTFLPLNKLKPAPSGLKLPKEKGVIDYAINLVDFDDEYVDAFFFALGDTLVVEDYETAQKLIGKYRIVTRRGDLFEKSGSITGGSMKKSGLKFSSGDNDEIETYKARLKNLQKQYTDLLDTKTKLEDKHEKIRNEYSATMTEHSKAKIELDSLVNNNEQNIASIENNKKRQEEIVPEIKNLDKKLNEFEEQSIKINQTILNLQDEISNIESQISEEELDKLKNSTESLENKIKDLEKQKTNLDNEINDINRDINFNKQTVIKTNQQKIQTLLNDNKTLEEDIKQKEIEIKDIEVEVEELNKEIEKLGDVLKGLQEERDLINKKILDLSTAKGAYENDLDRISEQLEALKTRRNELDPILEEARNQLLQANIDISKLEPTTISVDELTAKINRLEKRMQELEPVNMRAITAYDGCLNRKNELDEKINILSQERKEILSKMTGYEDLKKKTFLETYDSINENFKTIYAQLSEGEGELILENYESPFEGGLTLEAKPRDKKKTRLELLSGGEKTLAALSFVFAIQRNSPAPFYAFDEVDANLDSINVEKLSEMIKVQSKNTQFVVVSHHKPMIESACRTVGVTQKEKGVTRVTGVKLRD